MTKKEKRMQYDIQVFLYRPPRITSGVFVYLQALLYLDIAQLTVQA